MNSDSTNSPKNREPESNSALPDVELIPKQAEPEEKKAETTDTKQEPTVDNGEMSSDLQAKPTAINVESSGLTEIKIDSELIDLNSNGLGLPDQKINHIQVQLKTEEGKLLLILPTESQVPTSEISWSEIWQQMRQRLNGGDRLRTPNTTVHLVAKDRLLDTRQLQELAETLNEVKLQLKSVATSRRQTAIAACTLGYSVEQVELQPSFGINSITSKPQADALYLEMTVRSGGEIRHPGTVIILGDINPGGMVVADGDIMVWGRLRGVAHAGAGGNRDSLIMALQMEPTQLRIADAVARAPEKSLAQFFPEVAHITPQGIRIVKATDFSRSQLSKVNQNL